MIMIMIMIMIIMIIIIIRIHLTVALKQQAKSLPLFSDTNWSARLPAC